MNAAIKAGPAYFGAVFVVGFVLGATRVRMLIPRLGEIAAVSLEIPVILALSWFVSRWIANKFGLTSEIGPRLLMGAVAFALLMLAEVGVSVFAFGRSIEDHLATYWSPQGALGLAGQIAIAFFR